MIGLSSPVAVVDDSLTIALETLAGLLDDSDKRLEGFADDDVIGYCLKHKEMDADLRLIIERWTRLSVELRKAVVRMVE